MIKKSSSAADVQQIHRRQYLTMMEKAIEFINETLFTEEKPVLFTNLMHKFQIGPSKAKEIMYTYYRENRTTKYNCIIICCYKDKVQVIHDVNHVESEKSLVDCFIYAFNPTEEFTPVNAAYDQRGYLTISNPHKLIVQEVRSRTLEEEPVTKTDRNPISTPRSRTMPETKEEKAVPRKAASKIKTTGLRSTALLAKMRAERESKEAQRQEELKKRRQQQAEEHQQRNSAQLNELNKMFVDDSDEDGKFASETPTSTVDGDDLENILDTTAEESLLKKPDDEENSQEDTPIKQEQDSSYVDEDGYLVTNRPATSTPPKGRKRAASSLLQIQQQKKKSPVRKKTQGTLESFFKKTK